MNSAQLDLIEEDPEPGSASMDCPHCNGTGKIAAHTMGERLRALRLTRGLTPTELAERTNGIVSASNISSIERESNLNPKLDALKALAAELGVKVGYLIDGEGDT